MKMDQKMIIVSSLVGSLGVLSAILGFSAEGTKLTRSDVFPYLGVCLYPPNPALGLGVCAAIFLILAQTTFAVGGGCCGFYKSGSGAIPSTTNQIVGVICAVFSWIAAVFAFGLLVSGAASNAPGTRDSPAFGLCYVPVEGIFAGGAVLTLVAMALALTSYIILRMQPAAAAPIEGEQIPAGAAGITMAQPQFLQQPPQVQGCEQTPPNYPQYSPPPQGQGYGQTPNAQFPPASSPPYNQAPNPHYRPTPAQGCGEHAPNYHQQQQQFLHPPEQGYGVNPPNHQYPPPAHSYGGHAPDEQFPPASPPPKRT